MDKEWIEWIWTGIGALVFGAWAYWFGFTKGKADD